MNYQRQIGIENPAEGRTTKKRNHGIDCGKVVAFTAVVAIHAGLTKQTVPWFFNIENSLTRFAVPFFFIVSGYMLSARMRDIPAIARYCATRLVPAFAFWILVFHWRQIATWDTNFYSLMYAPQAGHLWFFPSLALCLVLVSIIVRYGGARLLAVVATVLYVAALILGPYKQILHAPSIDWNFRDGPFFGLTFVAIGYFLSLSTWRPSLWLAGLIFGIGGIGQVVEAQWIADYLHAPLIFHDYVVATLIFGLGAFLFFRALPEFRPVMILAAGGEVALGAYAIHPLILGRMRPFLSIHHALACVLATAFISIAICQVLSKAPALSRIVR